MLKLERLPFPPSANRLYFSWGGKMRPSKELVNYKKAMAVYGSKNRLQIEEIKCRCLRAAQDGLALCVARIFYMPRKRIFTKKGKVRKIDTTNRIKACDDQTGKLIGIDDSLIFSSSSRKQVCDDSLPEHVDITISFLPLAEFDIA